MGKVAGFSVMEALVATSVVSIVLAIGLPAFRATVERTRSAGAYHAVTASLMSARQAAIMRRMPVTVCPSRDARTCRGDRDWSDGWILFLDPARTGSPANAADILRSSNGPGRGMLLTSSTGRHRVRYLPDGSARGTNLTLRLCSRDAGTELGQVVVNNGGRARTVRHRRPPACGM